MEFSCGSLVLRRINLTARHFPASATTNTPLLFWCRHIRNERQRFERNCCTPLPLNSTKYPLCASRLTFNRKKQEALIGATKTTTKIPTSSMTNYSVNCLILLPNVQKIYEFKLHLLQLCTCISSLFMYRLFL